MTFIRGNPGEIHELARYEVRPEALDEVLAAIQEFVAYVRANEPPKCVAPVEFIEDTQIDANASFT